MKPGTLVVFREIYDTIAEVERTALPLLTLPGSPLESGVIRAGELSLVVEECRRENLKHSWSRIITPAGAIGWIEDAYLHQPDVKISHHGL